MMENKRFFGYSKYNGGHYPVLYYDSLPTDGQGKVTKALIQMVEVPEEHLNKTIDELALIYPYKEEENEKAASN